MVKSVLLFLDIFKLSWSEQILYVLRQRVAAWEFEKDEHWSYPGSTWAPDIPPLFSKDNHKRYTLRSAPSHPDLTYVYNINLKISLDYILL